MRRFRWRAWVLSDRRARRSRRWLVLEMARRLIRLVVTFEYYLPLAVWITHRRPGAARSLNPLFYPAPRRPAVGAGAANLVYKTT